MAESLRLEPAAAVVDRYATADAELAGARIRRGDLVRVSIAAANRDPAVFERPDGFEPGRGGAQHNLGFARGPHFCPGAQLASAETAAAVGALLDLLPGLRLDPDRPRRPARPGVPQAARAARRAGTVPARRPGWSAWPGPASSR